MELNNRQAYFIAELADACLKGQEIYVYAKRLLKSFAEEFATTQNNALDVIEGETTVNADSNSGQKDLGVVSTIGFAVGDSIIIDKGGARHEIAEIASIDVDNLNLVDQLQFTHTAAQADPVQGMGAIHTLGLDYASLVIACNYYLTQFINFWEGNAVATREYGKDARRIANNE